MLEQILATKREELDTLTLPEPLPEPKRRPFAAALRRPRRALGLIAEVKKASPSKGIIRPDFDPVAIAKAYERAGADAISVLTDERYFQGHRRYLQEVKEAVNIPVLRKDFIIDRRQVEESARLGADAILLIGEALPPEMLEALYQEAYSIGLECLVEVHAKETLERILARFTPEVVGINNRDLHTFVTTLEATKALASLIPPSSVIVSESGISSYRDVRTIRSYGVQAMLVGESLMRQADVERAVYRLFGEDDGNGSS
ncbi:MULTISPECIES: indole-3-glycerol phosphate synthase TrpC [Geobacillus]|jgi:indole-3-glycerol phosphate synthase|uniref:indole-3-glycerol phosphate synthase TrpC n=1 Tax=Geobacillus TaxID=129337 RepID=UPI00017E31F6|nr:MULTISPECIES: indole-3-glycerol phosphate synthase TrpC [Geobacillus]KQB92835.1 Indole-3-glycerol phosphate synthase [Geobacillus sp. PA-3]MED3717174.1 indole-3-glycerol phosphate synthase TrpC [Geobacillus thermodenitrificans]OQP10804.1 indole-3-glycerol phosphate synthase [Geobacillus sp. 47C-IIb]PTR46776.1 indole-3-glycerol phosphate synthase TrpC [Geobacillus thermodenitrificans]QNU31758.1 indole-3-glycerol phosphate synthase TrpC [Geobacillus sp. 47C-IIb]